MIPFNHPDLTIFLGPPGTGKTTSLLNVMEAELNRGVKPNKIGFVSFTKKATLEAKQRACDKFEFKPNDLPHFRTNHSMAFSSLGLDRGKVMQAQDYQEIGRACAVDITGNNVNLEDGSLLPGATLGDRLLFCDNLARNRCVTLRDQWKKIGDDEIDWDMQDRFSRTLTRYKQTKYKVDYTDMLEMATTDGNVPTLDVLIIDEAQDLSALQWRFMFFVARRTARVYIAGDDDQAIYRWAGADIEQFIKLEGKTKVLDESHRLPRAVHKVALAILGKISNRKEKPFKPRDEDGKVYYEADIQDIDMSEGTWLLLVRNNYLIDKMERHVRDMGYLYRVKHKELGRREEIYAIRLWEHLRKGKVITGLDARLLYRYISTGKGIKRGYKDLKAVKDNDTVSLQDLKDRYGLETEDIWHKALDRISQEDRDYYVRVLKRKEKLTVEPRITISTIHGAKGGQAENVVILTDMSARTAKEYMDNPDDEHRVFYVGVTRAQNNLYVIAARGQNGYGL